MPRRAMPLLLALIAAGLAVGQAAPAQIPPEEDPQLIDPSWREPVEDSGPAEEPETATAPDYRLRRAPLLPEGSFLPRRRGTLVRSGSGEWVYVFHPDEQGRAEAPMTLLPSATLERMEEILARRGADEGAMRTEFVLTGQVFVYGRTNYLLPTAFSLASPGSLAREEPQGAGAAGAPPEMPPEIPDAGGAGSPEEQPQAGSDLDAAIEDLIEQIEAERPGSRALGESSMLAAVTRASADGSELEAGPRPHPDGALLVRRRGRLTRQAGAWRFTIDNDADTLIEFQSSMVLLPCLNLERMETLAADRGENQPFEVSGMVLQYRGRNYLVPTIYRVVRGDGVQPLQ